MTNIETVDGYINRRKAELLINSACGCYKTSSNDKVRVCLFIDDPSWIGGRVIKLVANELDHGKAVNLIANAIDRAHNDDYSLSFTMFYKEASGVELALSKTAKQQSKSSRFTVVADTETSAEAIGNNKCGKFIIVE